MRVLFVTRKYPPSTGGMENAAYQLYQALAKDTEVQLVKYGGPNKWLPAVYPWLFLRAWGRGLLRRPDVIYLQDGIMGPMGWLLKLLLRRPTVLTVHGLEATYNNPVYKLLVPPFIKRQTRLTTGSAMAKEINEARLRGTHFQVIHHGVEDAYYVPAERSAHLDVIARDTSVPLAVLEKSKLLHTNGRLVARKGVLWFVEHVMPQLDASVVYLVSGKGKDEQAIVDAIERSGLQQRVFLLGRVSDEVLRALYNAADIFVMPNIPVANDMEGFGLVALEAASCGTLVVASKLEGIQDAIAHRRNGLLVEPGDSAAYVRTITRQLAKPALSAEAIRAYTLKNYSWQHAAHQYEALMRQLIS